jgi:hypothetical protein
MMNDAGCFLDIYFGGLGSFGVLLLLGLSLLFFSFSCCLLGVSTPGVVLEGSGYIPNYKRGILSFEARQCGRLEFMCLFFDRFQCQHGI